MDELIDTDRRMRVGTHYGIHLYLVGGGPRTEDHTEEDEPAGTAMAPWIAAKMAEAWNTLRYANQGGRVTLFTDEGLVEHDNQVRELACKTIKRLTEDNRKQAEILAQNAGTLTRLRNEKRNALTELSRQQAENARLTGAVDAMTIELADSRDREREDGATARFYNGDCPRCFWGNVLLDCGCRSKCLSVVCVEGAVVDNACPYCDSNRGHCSSKGLCVYALQALHPVKPDDGGDPWLLAHEYVEPSHVGGECELRTRVTVDGLGGQFCGRPRGAHIPAPQLHDFVRSDNLDPEDECVRYVCDTKPMCGRPWSEHRNAPKAGTAATAAEAASYHPSAPPVKAAGEPWMLRNPKR